MDRSSCARQLAVSYGRLAATEQCRSKPVSGRHLRKMGVFQISAGDYRLFGHGKLENWSLETGASMDGSPPLAGLSATAGTDFSERRDCLAGAGSGHLNFDMAIWNRMLSLVREEPPELFSSEIRRPFETFEFREAYRIRGVQSFGDKWVFRRIMSAPRREGVRRSKREIVATVGLNGHKLTRRICDLGQGGGESGIRTHGTVSRTHAFQACALSHSAISPDATLLKGHDDFCK